jgi:hypothetical protein
MNGLWLAAQRLDQLLLAAAQPSVGQRRQPVGVGFALRQRAQDAVTADAKQVADHAG